MQHICNFNQSVLSIKLLYFTPQCKLTETCRCKEHINTGLSVTCDKSINKRDHHDITEILLKVALNTINLLPLNC